jgi:hypothetical protein
MLVRLCALIFEFDIGAKQLSETSVAVWETATVGPTTLGFPIRKFPTEALASNLQTPDCAIYSITPI